MRTVRMYAKDVKHGDRIAERRTQSPGLVFMVPREISGEIEIKTTTGGEEAVRLYSPDRMLWVDIP